MVGKITKTIAAENKHSGDATCIAFHDGLVYSGGADGKIKIWDTNLQLIKEIQAHESYIFAIVINPNTSALYSSSCDGTIRQFPTPKTSNTFEILMQNNEDLVLTLVLENGQLYAGDDKGIVFKFKDNKIDLAYNLVEEVRSLAVQGNLVYTARETDVVVTELQTGPSARYFTKGVVAGRCPAILTGPVENNQKKYIIFCTRDGKGIGVVRNKTGYNEIWTKEDAHEMIINALCATTTILYSGGYDGKVKKWIELEQSPQNAGEATIGCCINAMCVDLENNVYVADTNGMIHCVNFSSQAA